jgi:hypothetical protein
MEGWTMSPKRRKIVSFLAKIVYSHKVKEKSFLKTSLHIP